MAVLGSRGVKGIVEQFKRMEDPRSHINRRHLLVDVIVISILGVVAGADGPTAIALWAKTHAQWLRQHLELPRGIPSRDTIARVLQSLKPPAFQQCFAGWLASLGETDSDEEATDQEDKARRQIAIDGKYLRRSHHHARGLGPLLLVNAWATKQGIALGQLAVAEKPDEFTAIPQLLGQLDVTGAVITIDAAGCHKKIADEILSGGGDYILALKGNQEILHREAINLFDKFLQEDFQGVKVSRHQERDTKHGRLEERDYYQVLVPEDSPTAAKWPGLKTFGLAIRRVTQKGVETVEKRYYISSLVCHGRRFAGYVRGHWGIENTLHWVLDMAFREDENRVRERRLADNLAWLRRLAVTLLKQHPGQQSIVMKRRLAGWSIDFLMQVLTGTTT